MLAALSGLSLSSRAQRTVGDSIEYWQNLSAGFEGRAVQAARQSDSGRLIASRLDELQTRNKSYVAFMILGEATAADYSKLNAAIARDGFSSFSGPLWRFGLGFSRKTYSGVMFDFNYVIADFGKTRKANGNSISTEVADFLSFQVGYAVVNSSRFDIYPYAGLSLRGSWLSYSAPATVNPSFRSIASLIQDDQSASGSAYHLGYSAGIGMEYAIAYNAKSRRGTMLFAKFGTDGIFGSENYHISGVNYDSGIKYGAWIAELGFKFFGPDRDDHTDRD